MSTAPPDQTPPDQTPPDQVPPDQTPPGQTAAPHRAGPARRVGPGLELYKLFLTTLSTRSRLVGLALFGLVAVVVGAVFGSRVGATDQVEAWVQFANAFGLSLLAPVVCLLFASAALGGPAEDGTLVYLWLRPVRRARLALAAYGASLTFAAPLVILPLGVGAALSGAGADAVVGTVAAATSAVIAYTAIFGWLGLRTRRALAWGLGYVLIWEGFVAMAGDTASRLAVRAYTRSILAEVTGVDLRLADVSPAFAALVPFVVAVVAVALTARRLRRTDVA